MADIDEDIPLTWRRVFLTLLSYVLFFTDVPRSGYGYASMPAGYYQVSPTMATYFGPYSYLVIDIVRSTDGALMGKTSSGVTNTTTVWSYKLDTCSVGMRSLVQQLKVPSWPPCVIYQEECDGPTLEIDNVFTMLDSLMDKIKFKRETSIRVDYRFDDRLEDYTTSGIFQQKQRRTVHSHYMTKPLDLCQPQYAPRPYFCEMPWYNFNSLGYNEVSVISSNIQAQMNDTWVVLNQTNQRLDMAIIDSAMHQQPWIGSLASTQGFDFDVVTILRVQNCTDINKTNCSTVQIQDFRYEGGFNNTNIPRWYALVKLLRFLGQSYNIIRVFLLIIGCYYARVAEVKYAHAPLHLKVWVTMTTFLRIPAQVVIYGSWFPVVLFVLAHGIDSSELYFCITKSFVALDGTIATTPSHLYYLSTMLSCHMRNVWVLCLAIKFVLILLHKNDSINQGRKELIGFRGYVLPLVSLISIIFDIRAKAARKMDFITAHPVAISLDTALIRHYELPSSDYRISSIYLDMKNLILSYIALQTLLWLVCIRVVRYRTKVPQSILSFGNRTMFSTCWNTLLLDRITTSLSSIPTPSASTQITSQSDHILMNILWMTDPIESLSLIWNTPRVYCYCHKETKVRVHHPLAGLELEDHDIYSRLKDDYDCESTVAFNDLSWRERIECL